VSNRLNSARPNGFGVIKKVDGFSGLLEKKLTIKHVIAALQSGSIRFRRNRVIASEGEAADFVFLVVSGVVRSCKNYKNGGRGVVAFYLPGDLFGWSDEERSFCLEAASDTVVLFLKRSALVSLADHNTGVAGLLLETVTNQLRRAEGHAALMSVPAVSRVASFLIDFGRRLGTANSVRLSMSHQDIADHLGLKIETLSRMITQLQRSGIVSRSGPRTLIVDNERLLRQINL